MAKEKQQGSDRRDSMAWTLFIELYLVDKGRKTNESLAAEACKVVDEFLRVVDSQESK